MGDYSYCEFDTHPAFALLVYHVTERGVLLTTLDASEFEELFEEAYEDDTIEANGGSEGSVEKSRAALSCHPDTPGGGFTAAEELSKAGVPFIHRGDANSGAFGYYSSVSLNGEFVQVQTCEDHRPSIEFTGGKLCEKSLDLARQFVALHDKAWLVFHEEEAPVPDGSIAQMWLEFLAKKTAPAPEPVLPVQEEEYLMLPFDIR